MHTAVLPVHHVVAQGDALNVFGGPVLTLVTSGSWKQSGSGDVLGSAPLAGSGTFAGLSQMLNVRKI